MSRRTTLYRNKQQSDMTRTAQNLMQHNAREVKSNGKVVSLPMKLEKALRVAGAMHNTGSQSDRAKGK